MSNSLGVETIGTVGLLLICGGILPLLGWELISVQQITSSELALEGMVLCVGASYHLWRLVGKSDKPGQFVLSLLKQKLVIVNVMLLLCGFTFLVVLAAKSFPWLYP